LILIDVGNNRAAVRELIKALRRRPGRPEPYFHLASILRGHGHRLWAARLARAGLALGTPDPNALFVDREACTWGLLRELSIAAYATPFHAEGGEANERLAIGFDTPPDLAAMALQNAIYYVRPLSSLEHIALQPTLPDGYAPCNPSILRNDD